MATRVSSLIMAFAVAFVLVGTSLFQRSEAAVYLVGDGLGWIVPSNGSNEYQNWAEGKKFTVGDVLEFRFSERHDVAEVTKEDFEACTANNPIVWIKTGPAASISLTTAGDSYFICTKPGHCTNGQKLQIKVANGAEPF